MISRIAFAVITLLMAVHAQDYTKLVFRDCGSKSVDIQQVDMKPMPLYNPGPAFFTFVAQLKRPVKVLNVSLDIIRTVSGIALPVKCYVVSGQSVGSCSYSDLCVFLQNILAEFKPEICPPGLAQFGIDCRCPFNVNPQLLNIVDQPLDLPDASQTAATFLASGNFNITVIAREPDISAPSPYGCGNVLLTIKQKK